MKKPTAKPRQIRMSDAEWAVFRELGGAEWLRGIMLKKPAQYHEVFKKYEPRPTTCPGTTS